MYDCTGVTLASLESLFSTSVQGCLLKVDVCLCQGLSLSACTQCASVWLHSRAAVTHLCWPSTGSLLKLQKQLRLGGLCAL
jgi:hypothetical protein